MANWLKFYATYSTFPPHPTYATSLPC